jgi:hypothetical protein
MANPFLIEDIKANILSFFHPKPFAIEYGKYGKKRVITKGTTTILRRIYLRKWSLDCLRLKLWEDFEKIFPNGFPQHKVIKRSKRSIEAVKEVIISNKTFYIYKVKSPLKDITDKKEDKHWVEYYMVSRIEMKKRDFWPEMFMWKQHTVFLTEFHEVIDTELLLKFFNNIAYDSYYSCMF